MLNLRLDLHAIDATPTHGVAMPVPQPLDQARTAASSPRNDLVKNCRVHPSHSLISTQVMLRAHFKASQFIVVSLKEGMFNNANVVFRTKFVDGVSTVARTTTKHNTSTKRAKK